MKKFHLLLPAIFLVVAVWSGIEPFDCTLWVLESLPVVIGLLILIFTYKRFQFTNLSYVFMLVHCCILLIGAHYSYAREPLFEWLKEVFGWERNNFDKVGHFAQGFIPAIITRELLVRLYVVSKKSWLTFITVSICLAISAFYELFEWFVAVIIKQSAEDFLGMQGYEWDTQSDMLCALTGAICAIALLSKIQDRQMEKLKIGE
jgi:putative membrane protein